MNTAFRVARQIYKYNMTLPGVAAALCISPSTVRHRLNAEGTSLRALLRTIRRRMLDKLIDGGKTVPCILHELGYERINDINRLLRDYKGMTYNEYCAFRAMQPHLRNLGLVA